MNEDIKNGLLDRLDFSDMEQRILTELSTAGSAFIKVDMAEDGTVSKTIISNCHKLRGLHADLLIIDDVYTEEMLQKVRYIGHMDQLPPHADWKFPLHAIDPFLNPHIQEEPEPRAKNGAKANRKTAKAKAVLPFYQKNRRF